MDKGSPGPLSYPHQEFNLYNLVVEGIRNAAVLPLLLGYHIPCMGAEAKGAHPLGHTHLPWRFFLAELGKEGWEGANHCSGSLDSALTKF